MFGISHPMALADSVAFLDAAAMCAVKDSRVSSSTRSGILWKA